MAGAFGKPNRARHHDLKDLGRKMLHNLFCHLAGKIVPLVIHGQQYAFKTKLGIEPGFDQLDGI